MSNGTAYDPQLPPIDNNETSTVCPIGSIQIIRRFGMGPGWIALLLSGCVKAVDVLLNLAIPAPTICRDRQEQLDYEQQAASMNGADNNNDNDNDNAPMDEYDKNNNNNNNGMIIM